MKNRGLVVPSLEQQHRQLFPEIPQGIVELEESSLEQPYFGQFVQTVTTYSVYEKLNQQLG
jgi:hypothetical protein